jgi:hypothetical protein
MESFVGYAVLGLIGVVALAVYFLSKTENAGWSDTLERLEEYRSVAEAAVRAAWATKDVNDNEGKLNYALDRFAEFFPDVDRGTARMFIENAYVLIRKSLGKEEN